MGKSSCSDTDRQIARAFLACLETTPMDKISVKSITDQCGLNRQTFYYHFHDIYDLTRWILQREARRVVHAAADAKSVYECINLMIHAMDENRSEFIALYNSSHYASLRQDYMEYLTQAQKAQFENVLREFGWGSEYSDFIVRINALVLTEFIEKWQKGHSVNTLDQFAKWFSLFIVQQKQGARTMADEVRRRQTRASS